MKTTVAVLRGIVLGLLLTLALIEWWVSSSGAEVFVYQGF